MIGKRARVRMFVAWLNAKYKMIDPPYTLFLWGDRYVRNGYAGVYLVFTEEYNRPPVILIAGRRKTSEVQRTYAHELTHHGQETGYFEPCEYSQEDAAEGNARTLVREYQAIINDKRKRR